MIIQLECCLQVAVTRDMGALGVVITWGRQRFSWPNDVICLGAAGC